MKNLKVLAATITLLVGASGAALAQPKQHDQDNAERRTQKAAVVSNQAEYGRSVRGSEISYAQPRDDRDDWNSSFVNTRRDQDEVRGRDRDDAAWQFRAVETRRGDERIQQTREVHARNMHPMRPGTSDHDRF